MARRPKAQQAPSQDPQYEWAFTADDHPVHISQAARGEIYVCPLCRGRMVAKRGEIKQHHFAHESLKTCTPEEVTRLVVQRWLAEELQACLAAQRSLVMTWPCPICQQVHTADLLEHIHTLHYEHQHDGLCSDVALLDAQGVIKAAIVLKSLSEDDLRRYTERSITVIEVTLGRSPDRMVDLATLLAGARIYGGVCTTQELAAQHGVVTNGDAVRDLLIAAVAAPPHNIYGPLDHFRGLTHVFLLGEQRLWLPPLLWQRAVGGLHHSINPTLQIISQEWEQPDGAMIALYYVTAKDTTAIAVRRFPAGQPVYARLDNAMFRTPRLNAVSVARSFAEL